jgi:hypothetical protein
MWYALIKHKTSPLRGYIWLMVGGSGGNYKKIGRERREEKGGEGEGREG